MKTENSFIVADLSKTGQERRAALIEWAMGPHAKAKDLEYIPGHVYIPHTWRHE